jgi:predicted Zn-dependent protease
LLDKARDAARQGDLDMAEAQLERALRIEPRNAILWHYMAKLRLHQGRLDQAAGLAAKSNSLDQQQNTTLQADNWRIIAHARYRHGDVAGARAAQQHADDLLKND